MVRKGDRVEWGPEGRYNDGGYWTDEWYSPSAPRNLARSRYQGTVVGVRGRYASIRPDPMFTYSNWTATLKTISERVRISPRKIRDHLRYLPNQARVTLRVLRVLGESSAGPAPVPPGSTPPPQIPSASRRHREVLTSQAPSAVRRGGWGWAGDGGS